MSAGVLMVGGVVDRARRVFVHSRAARNLVLSKRPARGDDVYVVPFAHPPVHRHVRDHSGRAPVIASFGHLKQPGLILDAAEPLLHRDRSARLWFVGAGSGPADIGALREDVARRDLADGQVDVTGWVADAEYRRRLDQATIAVQIRDRFYGETSASVADCFAAGLPTVVNDIGALSELPPQTALRVSSHPDAGELGRAVGSLLVDGPRRRALSEAAMEHARSHPERRAARALADAIFSAGSGRGSVAQA
jgi:glycosyltransferase involved in cell wall biosynthesis